MTDRETVSVPLSEDLPDPKLPHDAESARTWFYHPHVCTSDQVRTAAAILFAEIDTLRAERDELRAAFACQVCDCGSPRRSCNLGLRHKTQKDVGASAWCVTCLPDSVDAVLVHGTLYCSLELLDHLVHEQFENDCKNLEIDSLKAMLDPEFLAWWRDLPVGERGEIKTYILSNYDLRRQITALTAKEEITKS